MKRRILNQRGFTVIELMIATLIFSIILLVITSAIIGIGRFYYKAYTSSQTQEVTRNIIEDISSSIKYSGRGQSFTTPKADPNNDKYMFFCIGARRYSYIKDFKLSNATAPELKETRHGFVVDVPNSCDGSQDLLETSATNIQGNELLGFNMRLADVEIKATDATLQTFSVRVRVLYGDPDLIDGAGFSEVCKSGAGRQYCAVSELSTLIQKRVN